MIGGRDPVRGGVHAKYDGRGIFLPGVAYLISAVQGVRGGYGGWIDGMAQEYKTWASVKGEMELDNLYHRGKTAHVPNCLPGQGRLRSCPVEGCPGQAATRTEMRVHFMHRYVQDTVVILEEENIPHPR